MEGLTYDCKVKVGDNEAFEENWGFWKQEGVFDRAWGYMGLGHYMAVGDMHRLLDAIDRISCNGRPMAKDPGMVLKTQILVSCFQDMFECRAEKIEVLRDEAAGMLLSVLGSTVSDMEKYSAPGSMPRNRLSMVSDDMSEDDSASLMEFDGGHKRSMSVLSGGCDSNIDMLPMKAKQFNLCEILDEIEEHHQNIHLQFAAMETQLVNLADLNQYHSQYLKELGGVNDNLHERLQNIRYELNDLQNELHPVSLDEEQVPDTKPPLLSSIDLTCTSLTLEDKEILARLSQSKSNITSAHISTQIIAFISILLLIISFIIKIK